MEFKLSPALKFSVPQNWIYQNHRYGYATHEEKVFHLFWHHSGWRWCNLSQFCCFSISKCLRNFCFHWVHLLQWAYPVQLSLSRSPSSVLPLRRILTATTYLVLESLTLPRLLFLQNFWEWSTKADSDCRSKSAYWRRSGGAWVSLTHAVSHYSS